jgi:hypothetical protein
MAGVFSEIKFACCHLFMYKKKTYHNLKILLLLPGSILNFKILFPTVGFTNLEEQQKN